MSSTTGFDVSGLAEAIDIYSHIDFDIPVMHDEDDAQEDAIGDVDPDFAHDSRD